MYHLHPTTCTDMGRPPSQLPVPDRIDYAAVMLLLVLLQLLRSVA